MGLIQKLAIKFLKGNWGKLLPGVFKAAAEGSFGEPVRKLYWFLAGKKTILGAVFVGVGYGLEAICNANPDYAWGCAWSGHVMAVGQFLALVGLVDGGTRSPWPTTPEGGKPWSPSK